MVEFSADAIVDIATRVFDEVDVQGVDAIHIEIDESFLAELPATGDP